MKPALSCVLCLVVWATCLVPHVLAEPLVRIDLGGASTPPGVSPDLPEPKTDGPVSYRVLPGSGTVTFTVEPWWKGGVQPAEGTIYLAQVRYKDTMERPAVFLSFAGLGGGEGPSEMHRFGGAADGQWKTAQVPLPWDMVLRDFDSGKVRLGIRSAGELPVASIEIVPADEGAAARYNAETREWVRRAQADLKAADGPATEPAIPAALREAAIVPYVRPYVQAVLPHDVPREGEADATVRVRMARNEYEPGTFAVYAAKGDLRNVTFEVGPLKDGDATLAADVRLGTLEYTKRERRQGGAQVVAERIWPMYPVDIAAGQSHWFWITLKTDAKTSRPGLYRGTITIRSEQGQATLPMEVEVVPITLVTLQRSNLHYGGCHPALLPAHEMQELLEHNLNIVNIWASGVGPRIKIQDGRMTLDFRMLDHWMRTARACGVEAVVWFLGGVPYGYPRTLTIERQLYVALHAGEKPDRDLERDFIRLTAQPESRGRTLAEVEPYYRQWVREVWQQSRVNDWPEVILTPFDEAAMWVQGPYRKEQTTNPDIIGAGPWIRDHFEYASNLIHEAAPQMRVYASIHHNHVVPADYKAPADDEYPPVREGQVFLDDIDILCTNAIDEDPRLGEMTRAMGKDFWQYSGVGDPNRPDRMRYTFGFFFGGYNSRGGLVWAYDWGSGFDTSRGSNWYLAWRTPFEVIPSPNYECLREGLDDRRYVETLKRLAADHQTDASEFLAELDRHATGLRTAGGRDTVSDFWAEARDIRATDVMRQRVIERIAEVVRYGWRPAPATQGAGPAGAGR